MSYLILITHHLSSSCLPFPSFNCLFRIIILRSVLLYFPRPPYSFVLFHFPHHLPFFPSFRYFFAYHYCSYAILTHLCVLSRTSLLCLTSLISLSSLLSLLLFDQSFSALTLFLIFSPFFLSLTSFNHSTVLACVLSDLTHLSYFLLSTIFLPFFLFFLIFP